MAYIYLDELKDVLPAIIDQWIDGDDESWEWIFQEIEQKCHVGKRKKDKKQKKYAERIDELTRKVDVVTPQLIADLNSRTDKLIKRVDELKKYATDNLSSRINELSNEVDNSNMSMNSKINTLSNDIKSAKYMAQTAKQRTEVDYTKCSKEKSDADVVQEVYNRMAGRGATREELDTFRNLIQKYDALEKKEIPVVKKMCETCKYYVIDPDHRPLPKFDTPPCNSCNGNDKWEEKVENTSKMEAKDNGNV